MIKHITISPKDALEKLKEGNKRYITAEFNPITTKTSACLLILSAQERGSFR